MGLLDVLDPITREDLVALTAALNANTTALGGTVPPQGAPGAGIGVGAVSLPVRAIQVPITLQTLNQTIVAAKLTGQVTTYANSFGLSVPAGSTVTQDFPTGGLPTVLLQDLTVDATTAALVNNGLKLQAQVDGADIVGPASSPDYTISGKRAVALGQYYVVLNDLNLSVTNNLTETVTVFFDALYMRMDPKFYSNVYLKAVTLFGWPYIQSLLQGVA